VGLGGGGGGGGVVVGWGGVGTKKVGGVWGRFFFSKPVPLIRSVAEYLINRYRKPAFEANISEGVRKETPSLCDKGEESGRSQTTLQGQQLAPGGTWRP